jgi:hypothetical protein
VPDEFKSDTGSGAAEENGTNRDRCNGNILNLASDFKFMQRC